MTINELVSDLLEIAAESPLRVNTSIRMYIDSTFTTEVEQIRYDPDTRTAIIFPTTD